MILSFEGFRAQSTRIFSFIAVSQLVLCQGTGIVEELATDRTFYDRSGAWPLSRIAKVLCWPTFASWY